MIYAIKEFKNIQTNKKSILRGETMENEMVTFYYNKESKSRRFLCEELYTFEEALKSIKDSNEENDTDFQLSEIEDRYKDWFGTIEQIWDNKLDFIPMFNPNEDFLLNNYNKFSLLQKK